MWIGWGRLIKAGLACCVGYSSSDLELARIALVRRRRCLYIGPYTWGTHSVPRNTFHSTRWYDSTRTFWKGHVILSRLVNTRHTRGYSYCSYCSYSYIHSLVLLSCCCLLMFLSHVLSLIFDCCCCCCASLYIDRSMYWTSIRYVLSSSMVDRTTTITNHNNSQQIHRHTTS